MNEGSSNSRQRAIALVIEALQSCESANAGLGKTERARRAMEWRLLSEERPRAFVEQSPVSVYIDQLDETSFADLCREIQAMSSAVRSTKRPGCSRRPRRSGSGGGKALGPLGGRVDER
jgi:hypothetical protein